MDGGTGDAWSAVASEWAELWGSFAEPARQRFIDAAGIQPGSRVLDVGCGSGEFLVMLDRVGAITSGIDPAPGMIDLARSRVPRADIRLGGAESLPWPERSFDVVAAVNALHFADDTDAALSELTRVAVPGGRIVIANWAEGELNDLNVIESAVAASYDEELLPDGELRLPGGLERLIADAGLDLLECGLIDVPWAVPGDDRLVRGVLMGEDAVGRAAGAATVIEAARSFRTGDGGYRLANAFRYVIARTPLVSVARA
ncbi:SAM-dependent methyltransferase [Mycetocola sp. CAN_C7]|uniref:class I SAM-dependent methyltransferase n=1 Tax=Mycetocola sp. CAN_C7 TaxID=2787724 RepID=UPI0018CB6FF6